MDHDETLHHALVNAHVGEKRRLDLLLKFSLKAEGVRDKKMGKGGGGGCNPPKAESQREIRDR